MSENLRNFTKAIYAMDAVVHRVPNDRWDEPSPCEGWTARDVVAHQVGVLNGAAATVRSGEMQLPAEPEERADPVLLWDQARDEVLEALDHAGALQRSGRFWFGDQTVDEFIGVVQWDPLIHAWDLGRATGVDVVIDPELARRTYDTLAPMRAQLAKRHLIAEHEVAVAADAGIVDRLLGLAGRDPSA